METYTFIKKRLNQTANEFCSCRIVSNNQRTWFSLNVTLNDIWTLGVIERNVLGQSLEVELISIRTS